MGSKVLVEIDPRLGIQSPNMTVPSPIPVMPSTEVEESQLLAERRHKLAAMRQRQIEGGPVVFPNDFKPSHHALALHQQFGADRSADLSAPDPEQPVRVAGRMMLKRVMGKASFATLADVSGRIQLYVTRDDLGEEQYAAFKHWDLGDILGAVGKLFKTKTGELSIQVTELRLLTKSLRPLPDKFHGIADQEIKYRQRYVDLITDDAARQRFVVRSKAISSMRDFMTQHHFLEVETPMLHPIAGGANAKPFVTHHNALDQQMYLRIAPELYLKKLIVGGFERVFEINRNFRNEGISVRHNPEFTMMEFYAAYWNYLDLMGFTEAIIRHAAQTVLGTLSLVYNGKPVDLAAPFRRMTIGEAIAEFAGQHPDPQAAGAASRHLLEQGQHWCHDQGFLVQALLSLGRSEEKDKLSTRSVASLQFLYFEDRVEDQLWQPTFIMEHPTEVSPLARANDQRPEVTERFELYITGREMGNGFSELNDAQEQADRFHAQVSAKESGDPEAMFFDHDFVRALEYGMPPTAGCGIGIDRLLMLLTDSASIRDIILFPALRSDH